MVWKDSYALCYLNFSSCRAMHRSCIITMSEVIVSQTNLWCLMPTLARQSLTTKLRWKIRWITLRWSYNKTMPGLVARWNSCFPLAYKWLNYTHKKSWEYSFQQRPLLQMTDIWLTFYENAGNLLWIFNNIFSRWNKMKSHLQISTSMLEV